MTKDTKLKKKVHLGPTYLETIIIAVAITVATLIGYDRYMALKISTVDLKGYLRTQKALLVAGEISETEWQTRLDTIEQFLDKTADNPHHVILLKDVVLRNGETINFTAE
jgi:hypothetical protein